MLRKLKINNCYELYENVETTVEVEVDPPTDYTSQEEYEDYLEEELFQYTGVGHVDGNSYYEIASIDGLEPVIHLEYG